MKHDGKTSFVLYADYRKHVEKLTDAEAGALFKCIFAFIDGDTIPVLSDRADMAFSFISEQLARDSAKWEQIKEFRKTAGALGGKQKQAKKANASLANANQANQAVNVNVDVDVPVTVNENEKGAGDAAHSQSAPKQSRHKYGQYQNVLLSDFDLEQLRTEFPSDFQARIDRLSEYLATSGKSYKNHLATIRAWARRDAEKKQEKQKAAAPEPVYDLSFLEE